MGGGQTSTTRTTIPSELKPLYKQTGQGVMEYQSQNPLTQFAGSHPMRVAGMSANQRAGLAQAGNVGATPESERLAMERIGRLNEIAGRRVTGQGVENDPTILAALRAYELNSEPALVNQTKLMGLGNSSAVTNALSRGRAGLMLPLIQDVYGREERGIDRALQAEEYGIDPLMRLGGTERQGRLQQLQALMDTGGTERDIEQQGYASEYQDFLRRMGLSEEALYKPFGAFVPSTLGTRTSGAGGK